MTNLTKIKIALAVIGLVIFFAGVRFDDGMLRGIGIAFVAAAWVMRFVKQKPPPAGDAVE